MVPLRTEPDGFLIPATQQDFERDIMKVQRRVTGVQMKARHCDGFLERSFDKCFFFCFFAVNLNMFIFVVMYVCVSVSEKPEVTM